MVRTNTSRCTVPSRSAAASAVPIAAGTSAGRPRFTRDTARLASSSTRTSAVSGRSPMTASARSTLASPASSSGSPNWYVSASACSA